MIIPFLRGFASLRAAPFTWLLVALNCVAFLASLSGRDEGQARLEALASDEAYVATQGAAFAFMIEREPSLFSEALRRMAARAREGDFETRDALGALAFRNPQFMAHAPTYPFEGDEVALASWRERLRDAYEALDRHPSFAWGLSHRNAGAKAWITYQFAHSGFVHLALNMAFLLIFGSFIEARAGWSFVALGYVLSGIAGAFAFVRLTGLTLSPLVGASASVSGLASFVAIAYWRERVPFFYLIFPQPGYSGFVAYPAWLILVLFMAPDVAGYWASLPDVSSVAYASHLGGAAFGALMAWGLRAGFLEADPYDPDKGFELFEGEL